MDGAAWNMLVQAYAPRVGGFLQSYEWGEFQRSLGREVLRIQEERNGKVMLAQAIKLPLPMGQHYWFVPKGPIGDMDPAEMVHILNKRFKDQKAVFSRFEPQVSVPGIGGPSKEIHPATTLVLDLTPGFEAVFNQFDAKARYNIRLSGRKGVECAFYGFDRFDDFARLMHQTALRDRFSLHPVEYYRRMLEFFKEGEVIARLGFAMLQDKPLATIITIDFDGQRIDLFGASGDAHREYKAPHALRNFVVQDACERGLRQYDFWGIAPEGAPETHPWHGLTYFKKSFGGEVVQSPGTYEVGYSWAYPLYVVAKALRGRK